jgi:hypothetical protein
LFAARTAKLAGTLAEDPEDRGGLPIIQHPLSGAPRLTQNGVAQVIQPSYWSKTALLAVLILGFTLLTPGRSQAAWTPVVSHSFVGVASWSEDGKPLTNVQAEWRVPDTPCSVLELSRRQVAVWVGLSGYIFSPNGPTPIDNSWLPQVGTRTRCWDPVLKGPERDIVWELCGLPKTQGHCPNPTVAASNIPAGTLVHAEINYLGDVGGGQQAFHLMVFWKDAAGVLQRPDIPVNETTTPANVNPMDAAKYGSVIIERPDVGLAEFVPNPLRISRFAVSPDANIRNSLDVQLKSLDGTRELAVKTIRDPFSWDTEWKAAD